VPDDVDLDEAGRDVFMRMAVVRKYGIPELQPGQHFAVRYGEGPKGPITAEIYPDAKSLSI